MLVCTDMKAFSYNLSRIGSRLGINEFEFPFRIGSNPKGLPSLPSLGLARDVQLDASHRFKLWTSKLPMLTKGRGPWTPR